MSEDRTRTRDDVLARITDNPQLARAVPLLQPMVLHAVIAHCGLQDCGELLALATREQLAAVFDLDLWKAERPGAEEHFDAARFCEWLEVLVDAGPATAAARLAEMDAALVVVGLSSHITVLDPAIFSPTVEPSGADAVLNAGRERGEHAEIGGYIVVARRSGAWDAIREVLLALDEHHSDAFQRVMRGCRRLSDSGREIDGLDDLLPDAAQGRFDLSLGREQRRDRLGFLPPQQARAFLDSARRLPLTAKPPQDDPVFAAYRREMKETEIGSATDSAVPQADAAPADTASAVASVIEVLRGAGVLADARRALLPGAHDEPTTIHAGLNHYLQLIAESGDAEWIACNQELAFLANALVTGCSVHGRPFTPREAMDAAAATCNLGLEYWPHRWLASSNHTLVTVFQVGWTVLHREVSMVAADKVLDALTNLSSSDRDFQFGLHVLQRELNKHRQAGTPWRARDRLDVLAALDLPAWAALTALFDECPVMLANVRPSGGRRPLRVNPSEFQFIADARHVTAVHEFLLSLTELLTC
jgi:Family of unknown function (DUF6178)